MTTRAWALSALATSALLGSAACDRASAPTAAELRGYTVSVPAGWTAEREGSGPTQELVLSPEERTVVCRLVVVRDGRRFGATDVSAFLQSGRDAFGGRRAEEGVARIETASGALEGIAIAGADVPASFAIRALSGEAMLEIVAAARGTDLVVAMVGRYTGDPNGEARTAECRASLASLR